MPELFVEIFSEEIPARMQAAAGAELRRITAALAAPLAPADMRIFWGPRRLALSTHVADASAGGTMEARGPRDSAPEAALAGFLGKHGAQADDLVKEGGHYWLRRAEPPVPAAQLLAGLGPALARFTWPKSMRWGQGGDFTWVRPLRGFLVLLDGAVIPSALGPVAAGDTTYGHRVMGPGAFTVTSAAQWESELRTRFVIADPVERRRLIEAGLAAVATEHSLTVVPDEALLTEVTGLVEWPVALLGRIDTAFMDLPPEVRELSMKVNQKYFSLRDAAGQPAPYFGFVANLAAPDGGAAIIAGNERVLRARLADARHFWDLDLKTPLEALLPKLEAITFHAKLGDGSTSQRARADRIAGLAGEIAEMLGGDSKQIADARTAGRLCKADLVTGMVGEFPELQGVMGGYYAAHGAAGWDGTVVGPAIKTHYQPKGPSDAVPTGPIAASVALADKIDTLREFFRIGETPTGSGDPYALRRAALGVIRTILENDVHLSLNALLGGDGKLHAFIIERLRVKLRGEGKRFDILDAVLARGQADDLVRIMQRVQALSAFLEEPAGKDLIAAYRRGVNILTIEDAKDGPHTASQTSPDLPLPQEQHLQAALIALSPSAQDDFNAGNFRPVIEWLAALRGPVDDFFTLMINADVPTIRRNRLGLLAQLRDAMHMIADFSKIEG
jgi:glycyl-tRNA synthetase beta chain